MRRDARMLAAPLGRPVGLGEAWEVSETWFEEVEGGPTSPAPGWPGGGATRSPARSAACTPTSPI